MNETSSPIPSQTPETVALPSKRFTVAGLLVGAFIGFLLRPSAMLIGQLPFTVVMTRGANLEGLDEMLVPLAQTSFNYMLVGGVVGALVGLVGPRFLPKQ